MKHMRYFPPEIVEGRSSTLLNRSIRPNIISGGSRECALSIRESNGNYFLHPVVRTPEAYGSSLEVIFPRRVKSTRFVCCYYPRSRYITDLSRCRWNVSFPGCQKARGRCIVANPTTAYTDTAFIWNIDTTGMVDIAQANPYAGF